MCYYLPRVNIQIQPALPEQNHETPSHLEEALNESEGIVLNCNLHIIDIGNVTDSEASIRDDADRQASEVHLDEALPQIDPIVPEKNTNESEGIF